MKKQILLASLIGVLLLSFSGISSAQMVYINNHSSKAESHRRINNFLYWGYYSYSGLSYEILEKHQIKEQDITTYKYKKDGKRAIQVNRRIEKFNNMHLRSEFQDFWKGKEQSHKYYEYNSNGNKTDCKYNYKGNYFNKTISEYDDLYQLINQKRYYNNELQSNSFAEYKDTVLITQFSYHEDSIIPAYKWDYTYYPTGDKKQTQYYKKGELNNTWSYTCDDEGQEVKPKEEIKICELKQYNADSTYVIINRTTNSKGKISKIRRTFNKEDRIILVEHVNIKEEITYKQSHEYNKAGKRTKQAGYYTRKYADKISSLTTITYLQDSIKVGLKKQYFNKKDQTVRWASENKFNGNGRLIEAKSYGKNNELMDTDTYSYNKDNQITSSISINAEGITKGKSSYSYNSKGLLTETHSFDKDNIPTRSIIRKYQYFE